MELKSITTEIPNSRISLDGLDITSAYRLLHELEVEAKQLGYTDIKIRDDYDYGLVLIGTRQETEEEAKKRIESVAFENNMTQFALNMQKVIEDSYKDG